MGSGRAGCRGTCRTLCPAPRLGWEHPLRLSAAVRSVAFTSAPWVPTWSPPPWRYQRMSLALEQKPGAGVDVPEGAQQGSLGARGVCRGDLGPWSQGRANGRRGGHGWGVFCAPAASPLCAQWLCRDVPAAVLRVGAGHSVAGSSWPCSERRKEERRGASASAPASRDRSRRAGAHGAGLPSSPHPDGAAASIRPREPWARGSDCRNRPSAAPWEGSS